MNGNGSNHKKAWIVVFTVIVFFILVGIFYSPNASDTSDKLSTDTDDTEYNNTLIDYSSDDTYDYASSNTDTYVPNVSLGKQNALESALSYLNYSAFSYSGLIEQLEFEDYSTEEATYAVDNCGADWNVEAALCAQEYLDYSSFSRADLIEQLEFEGFTASQAQYGAKAVGY